MPKVTTVTVRGEIVQDLRERMGLSREQLGKKIGRSHESIRRIEHSLPVGRLLVCQVANVLKADVEQWIQAAADSQNEGDDEQPEEAAA